MSNYSELLKDPRWQKKRLEILNRDEFKCVICGDCENTLHVHHWQYRKGCKPWEYDFMELSTLCESCHGIHHLKGLSGLEVFLISCLQNRDYGIPGQSAHLKRIIESFINKR